MRDEKQITRDSLSRIFYVYHFPTTRGVKVTNSSLPTGSEWLCVWFGSFEIAISTRVTCIFLIIIIRFRFRAFWPVPPNKSLWSKKKKKSKVLWNWKKKISIIIRYEPALFGNWKGNTDSETAVNAVRVGFLFEYIYIYMCFFFLYTLKGDGSRRGDKFTMSTTPRTGFTVR